MADYYQIGLGMLGYTPEQFRDMTIEELQLAFDGYLQGRGVKKKQLMSRNELLDLMGK